MALTSFLTVSKHIQSILNENHIDSRRDAGPGLWVSALLPTSIIIGQIKYSTTYKYKAAACISCGLLLHTILHLIKTYHLKPSSSCDIILTSLVTFLLLNYFTLEGLLLSAVFSSICMFCYPKIILPLMKLCPYSFTYGEATLICQSFIIFLITFLVREDNHSQNCMEIGTTVLQFGIICLVGIVTLSYYHDLKGRPLEFYCLVGFIVIFVLIPSLNFLIGENPLKWVFHLVTEDAVTIKLMGFWSICTILAVVAVLTQVGSNEKATTAIRKVFHLLALLVFVPGIIFKPCLLYVASGVVFAIFIFLDTLRILEMPPLGGILQDGFSKFSDEKDEGPVALTPIYLLAGCALPLWMHPAAGNFLPDILPLISGLLSVGIGDSAASICGSLVGKNKWPGSKKTKEGTAACFLSQLFLVIALIHYGYVPRTNLIRPTFAIAICSLVEAKTEQVDNIVLPLLMYIMLM
ncbi:hypothetical protein O3M35_007353 [Rhynocoris fuscipes]|uniref:dolichol kinase n=1 Tax=Rhynocoris fuscipes TaxID=488301 RepID=A0AAW1DEF6_9HEMI